jgi:calcineurin-like phosphoesterase family protein
MSVWFTADTHFGHANIIKYCKRPFTSVDEMDREIVRRWNEVVGSNDTVYRLGDFAFNKPALDRAIHSLNGSIVFIKGNHDKVAWQNRSLFSDYADSYLETTINGQKFTLCHYAMRVWNHSHRGAWHLYGHSHGSLPDDKNALSIDVGVDCFDFRPVHFDQVAAIMAKKNWRPIDHHGERKDGGGIGLDRDEYARLERRRQYEMLKLEFKN